ncbi:hypothetical protein FB45DRAFT_986244 [Roridomyces roridus]|uniref:L-arabinokinase n=1 Tax=Roridomyces roridus TaxID=1738132 RepID=A0AAD7G1I4_9AGAR|nr:hypothetical protein FB45DRAFT_986244 [Roridomyces roridus]
MLFAFYVSGHGYGHATRVSALTRHLLQVDGVQVFIVSSAPKLVFADAIEMGARYRNAHIDPVIVQPLAYRVDRQKSVAALKSFLEKKDAMLETEQVWLKEINADCVLSDAAFLGCLAAKGVGIPAILVTNFTFDSVYSYLSTSLVDAPTVTSPDESHTVHHHIDAQLADVPVPPEELKPLVEQIHAGYRCADLLLRLPGYIPIPSFAVEPQLPSSEWVNPLTNRFTEHVLALLDVPPSASGRQIIPIPLLVRPPSPSIYSVAGRSKLLDSIGIPPHRHSNKILVVSFGGQVFRRPGSATPSTPKRLSRELSPVRHSLDGNHLADALGRLAKSNGALPRLTLPSPLDSPSPGSLLTSSRIATASHICIPGAPPVSKPTSPLSPTSATGGLPSFQTIPPTPIEYTPSNVNFEPAEDEFDSDYFPQLLPDDSWLAIVCGVSKEQWNAVADGGMNDDLPDSFFVAPRDVYMPDLTAVADVLLGKLGYGTVAECVDSCTPFVYVSRPLFIEEHGLRRLLEKDGVGVELPRELYEAGDWAGAIRDAWAMGCAAKEAKRGDDTGLEKKKEEGRQMADVIVKWVGAQGRS